MEMKEIITGMNRMLLEEKILSKVTGNRNWVIRIEKKDKIAYAGRFGTLRQKGFLSELVQTIVEDKISWVEYTYKKDFLDVIKILQQDDYTIKMIEKKNNDFCFTILN